MAPVTVVNSTSNRCPVNPVSISHPCRQAAINVLYSARMVENNSLHSDDRYCVHLSLGR